MTPCRPHNRRHCGPAGGLPYLRRRWSLRPRSPRPDVRGQDSSFSRCFGVGAQPICGRWTVDRSVVADARCLQMIVTWASRVRWQWRLCRRGRGRANADVAWLRRGAAGDSPIRTPGAVREHRRHQLSVHSRARASFARAATAALVSVERPRRSRRQSRWAGITRTPSITLPRRRKPSA